jgi:hypothetical protein
MLAVLAACASGPPPDQEIAAADLAVQAAHASTAGSLAPDELLFLGDDRRAGTERDVPVQVLWMSR